ncbi:acyl-CoA dehydrogenase family protein [Piscinibacter sakaiensis]|uniref:acyl-CoA dehydrogenase family protein n=1 Tax=Piscinibacter sakaiensis TaxID=1547922 RepID=UPI003AB0E965
MDFEFSDDQQSLREAVGRWVEKGFSFERRHGIAKAGGATREVYGELAELGLTGLAVPEAHGGMGFGAVEAMVVAEELGRGLVNAPFAQGALITPTLLSAADDALQGEWLPKIADGSALVVLAHQERAARYRLDHVTTRATEKDGQWRIDGQKSLVPAGDEADAFIVPARISGADDSPEGIALLLVDKSADGVDVRAYPTQDGARAAEVAFKSAPASLITRDGLAVLEHAVDAGIAALCAEAVGVMEKMLAVTVEYMNTRKQFGVAIATFQALRHRVADVKMQLELGRSMSYYASLKLTDPPESRRRAIAQAKVQICQSVRFVGQQCVQLHGGIGVTDEYIASHYFKRLTMIEMQFGDGLFHLGEVSKRMQANAGVFA